MKTKPLPRFTLSYLFQGDRWYFNIHAKSLKDARARFWAIKKSVRLEGELIDLDKNEYCKVGEDWVFVPGLPDSELVNYRRDANEKWVFVPADETRENDL